MGDDVFADSIYIDESVHTGDLLKSGTLLDFAGQPYFVLGAVGPIAEDHAARLLQGVVAEHRLKMDEVKSEQLRKRPGVARDLLKALRDDGVPVFIQAVDKVFFLVAQIVSCQVMPSTTAGLGGAGASYVRNRFADFLYDYLPDDHLKGFISACESDTATAVRHFMCSLLDWAGAINGNAPGELDAEDSDIAWALAHSLTMSVEEFDHLVAQEGEKYRAFLPVPDKGTRERLYWVLPNYSSLTSLYARINHYRARRVGDIRLIHDEQAQYDHILQGAKRAVENLDNSPDLSASAADYGFVERANLEFASSAVTPGLMIADVIAGHVSRVLRGEMEGKPIGAIAWEAFMYTWDTPEGTEGPGINFVLPMGAVERLHREESRRRFTDQAGGVVLALALPDVIDYDVISVVSDERSGGNAAEDVV